MKRLFVGVVGAYALPTILILGLAQWLLVGRLVLPMPTEPAALGHYYVEVSGDPASFCAADDPCSFARANDLANALMVAPGSVIHIREGTYRVRESMTFHGRGLEGRPIQWQGEGAVVLVDRGVVLWFDGWNTWWSDFHVYTDGPVEAQPGTVWVADPEPQG